MGSKRRKTKCDKALPCAPCVVQGEADSCEYEDGFEPPSQRLSAVPLSEHLALKARLDRLESALQQQSLTSSNACNLPDKSRTADQEMAFNAVEALAGSEQGKKDETMAPETFGVTGTSGGGAELFPNIMTSSTASRSAKWIRNVSQICEALPNKPQLDLMVDFYFSEVQTFRMFQTTCCMLNDFGNFCEADQSRA